MVAVNYNRRGDFALIIIKDSNDNQIYKKRINLANKQEYFDTMISIAEKYGFRPEIEFDKSINVKEQIKQEEKKELDWFGYSE